MTKNLKEFNKCMDRFQIQIIEELIKRTKDQKLKSNLNYLYDPESGFKSLLTNQVLDKWPLQKIIVFWLETHREFLLKKELV